MYLDFQIKNTQFCGFNERTCYGYGGGPVLVRQFVARKDQFTIIGITSGRFGGDNCNEKQGVPDYYTYLEHEEVEKFRTNILFSIWWIFCPCD